MINCTQHLIEKACGSPMFEECALNKSRIITDGMLPDGTVTLVDRWDCSGISTVFLPDINMVFVFLLVAIVVVHYVEWRRGFDG